MQAQLEQQQPEINSNLDVAVTPVADSPAHASTSSLLAALTGTATAGVPINEQMSRSMHEARNQIFEEQLPEVGSSAAAAAVAAPGTPVSAGSVPRSRRGGKQGTSSPEPIPSPPQLAFTMDPTYNVLWVFDGAARKLRCHNVVASDINDSDAVS